MPSLRTEALNSSSGNKVAANTSHSEEICSMFDRMNAASLMRIGNHPKMELASMLIWSLEQRHPLKYSRCVHKLQTVTPITGWSGLECCRSATRASHEEIRVGPGRPCRAYRGCGRAIPVIGRAVRRHRHWHHDT